MYGRSFLGCRRSAGGGLRLLWLLIFLIPLADVQATPDIQHWTTENGARVYFVQAPELPMVDVRVVFDAGSARDAGKAGLAQLTSAVLPDGAGDLSADEIAERFENVGARFGASAGRDMATVSLRSLTDPKLLQPALETFALILTRPAFAPADFERNRNQMLVAVRHGQQSPGYLAEKAFFAGLYGDHPYGSPPGGTEETLQAITREDVLNFYKRYYVARNAVVAIVGDLDRRAAERLVQTVVGGLPKGEAPPPLPEVEDLAEAREVEVPHPSAQSHVRIGQIGMARHDPQYFALYVGNHILGGSGLVSRLNDEIRERRGLSYSVYSYFYPMQRKGPFLMGLQTSTEQAEEAVRLLQAQLERFVTQGPTPEELAEAKKNITGGFALRIDSNGKIVDYLSVIGFYGLPLDYLDRFVERIEAVTLEDVRAAFKRHLEPERNLTVIVGRGAVQAREAGGGAGAGTSPVSQ